MKGFVFSLDAVVALSLVLIITFTFLLLSYQSLIPERGYQRLNIIANDVMDVITHITVNEVSGTPTVQKQIQDNIIVSDDLDRNILDIIGSFWSSGNQTIARNITQEVVEPFLNDSCFALYLETEEIYASCPVNGENLAISTSLESGYELGKPVSGFIARSFLSDAFDKNVSKFVFFGGYVGDGNISLNVSLPNLINVTNASLEVASAHPFNLFINGNFAGNFVPTSVNLSSDVFVIDSSYLNYFADESELHFNFSSNQGSITGGFVRVLYTSSQLVTNEIENYEKQYFQGIDGSINLFTSFYVPGNLSTMNMFLHYRANNPLFVVLGNSTVYESNETGFIQTNVSNSSLAINLSKAGFNYNDISEKTVPLRIGLRNISFVTIGAFGNADSILVTDVSGSMDECIEDGIPPFICRYSCFFGGNKECEVVDPADCTGNACGGFCFIPFGHCVGNFTKLDIAKGAGKDFVDIILNVSGNQVGLVSYATNVVDTHNISMDNTSLKNQIDSYSAGGATSICAGINEGVDILLNQSSPTKSRSIVIMSDGQANQECSQQGTGDPDDDAIQAACDAKINYDITVHSVAFGDDANNATMQDIANCGGGQFFFSNVTGLSEIYGQIAQLVLNASYVAQTIAVEGNGTLNSTLFSDSYIEFNFTSAAKPFAFGEFDVVKETDTLETMSGPLLITDPVTGTKDGWFIIPSGSEVIDVRVTSFSSNFWTDRLYLNNSLSNLQKIYWLPDYQLNYVNLGDPFALHIPIERVTSGNNSIKVGTGIGPLNSTGGSPDSRIIYTLRVDGVVGYGNVFANQSDAIDDANQRLQNKLQNFINFTTDDVQSDARSIGGVKYLWGPSRFKIYIWDKS